MKSAPDTVTSETSPKPRQESGKTTYTKPLLQGRKRIKYHILAIIWALAALWFWAWWLHPDHILPGARYWVVTFALSWLFILQILLIVVSRRAVVPALDPPNPDDVRVAMIVTKTPSEPFSLVRKTLEAMLAQTYPHDTWLADEDPQPETIAWCKAHGVKISTRKDRPDYHRQSWPRRTRCKEGNLAYFYDHYGYDQYDFVSQFDADHVPRPTYLEEIMRGFADPEVGYVSAPSICGANADESWAARTRLHTEAGFHGIFQCGYAGTLTPMCIGSHYAVRTKALKQVGGLGPELAEDHSTTMIMSAGGWKGVHAFDAIAMGDGPATVSDLCTQEFQWSRSLVSLLLFHTPRYFQDLPRRLRYQFVLCQLLYPIIAGVMVVFYFVPIVAVLFDIRYADVTYPQFILHITAPTLAMIAFSVSLKRDGFYRPKDGRVWSWEKALFPALQWPWVLWGCLMAVRDRVFGGFVDFRITPKGEAVDIKLPLRVVLPYVGLALGCFIPVIMVDFLQDAAGFYLLTFISGFAYLVVVIVIVVRHIRDHQIGFGRALRTLAPQMAMIPLLVTLATASLYLRGMDGLYALSSGLGKYQFVKVQYVVSGAGLRGRGAPVHYQFVSPWQDE
ncbi:glycosyltransferase [Roseovarius sp. A21]|uniref:Glycosyltransferase n=1 Tax=Roseovarius bejariae TaxID=2576383 RepID=A0A844CSD6_9RHOB|nr:glycosyltransferase family 2 protein [Roseovarius bejariae]MRU16365.1 glycosyltransferase [Roseovarius bejariae]